MQFTIYLWVLESFLKDPIFQSPNFPTDNAVSICVLTDKFSHDHRPETKLWQGEMCLPGLRSLWGHFNGNNNERRQETHEEEGASPV